MSPRRRRRQRVLPRPRRPQKWTHGSATRRASIPRAFSAAFAKKKIPFSSENRHKNLDAARFRSVILCSSSRPKKRSNRAARQQNLAIARGPACRARVSEFTPRFFTSASCRFFKKNSRRRMDKQRRFLPRNRSKKERGTCFGCCRRIKTPNF